MNEFITSPAFLYGESVFTTCLVKNGMIQLWQQHLDRLIDNAIGYYFLSQSDSDYLKKLVQLKLNEVKFSDGALRVTISSKNRDSLIGHTSKSDLIVSLSFRQITKIQVPVKLKTVQRLQSEILDSYKIGSYGKEIFLKKYYQQHGYDDLLFIGEGKVFEASTSNIFFKTNEVLVTPKSGIYLGVTRSQIIELNKVEERQISVEEIKSFDGAFVCNSVHGIVPIDSIDNIKFPKQDFTEVKF